MRYEFGIAATYIIALVYGILNIDTTASLAVFNVISFAAPAWMVISNIGAVIAWMVFAAGIFFWGQFTKLGRKMRGRTAGTVLFLGIWLNISVAYVLKHVIARARPPYELNVFELGQEYGLSMPSGHTQLAFMSAIILGYFYPKTRVPLMIFAVLVAISRVGLGAHWILDVLVGAANGLLIAAIWLSLPWKKMSEKVQKLFYNSNPQSWQKCLISENLIIGSI